LRLRPDNIVSQICKQLIVMSLVLSVNAQAGPEDFNSINGGELHILTTLPDKAIPLHNKTLRLSVDSLNTLWVHNSQCLANMDWWGDAVQIVFGKGKVRALNITHSVNIGKSWVEENTVQLEGIAEKAVLCLTSENLILHHDKAADSYTLTVGPFLFRLFDGFFPMTVAMRIDYPKDLLVLEDISPAAAPGIDIIDEPGQIHFRTSFEGVLWVKFHFRRAGPSIGW